LKKRAAAVALAPTIQAGLIGYTPDGQDANIFLVIVGGDILRASLKRNPPPGDVQ
jgi:hypothetical protein